MTAAGSIHNHLGWLGLWPLAESDNSELRDFYPPLNSKREPERERKEALLGLSKGRRSTSEKRGAGERMRRDMKWKKGWRHRKRWEDHTLQLTPEVLTLSGRHKHRKEVKSMKGEGDKEEWNVASDVLQKYLTFTWFWCVKSRQLESSKRPPVLSLSLSLYSLLKRDFLISWADHSMIGM